jgi:hypothetical protein
MTKTQTERREVLLNDTMLSRAQSERQLENQGRFAATNKSTVVGSTPGPAYPAGPNWANDPTGVEPPLGVDINELEPVGTAAEIGE